MAKLNDTQGFEPSAPIEASPDFHREIARSDGETSPPDSPKIHFEPFDRPCTRKEFDYVSLASPSSISLRRCSISVKQKLATERFSSSALRAIHSYSSSGTDI